jgi:hypothetical protein
LIGATGWLWVRRDEPPVGQLLQARLHLNLVRETTHEDEAASLLQAAQENLDQAQLAINAQYRRLVLFRNYDLARYHVKRGDDLSAEAVTTARDARVTAVAECSRRLDTLRRSLKTARSLLHRLTLRDGALTRLTSAEARLAVADSRLADHETREVKDMLDKAEEDIAEASIQLQSHLESFLTRRQIWNTWIRETLAWSGRGGQTAVLIDKLNHECYVVRGGRIVESYSVELGGSWMSQKIREGDRATPEGRYSVAAIKGSGNSRFYKAALLDYPNSLDRSRFVKAKRAGQLPRSARIGGMIEIHGEGGRGVDWTAGCISLANADLDRLLRHLRVGTPVTIVGVWQEPSWMSRIGSVDETGTIDRAD